MSELTRLRDEAERLLTTYAEYRDCDDQVVRVRVHVELDRFLMDNRETAAILMLEGLNAEIDRLKDELQLDYEKKPGIITRLRRRLRRDPKGQDRDKSQPDDLVNQHDKDDWHEDPDQPRYFNN